MYVYIYIYIYLYIYIYMDDEYMGTSLVTNRHPLGLHSKPPPPRTLLWARTREDPGITNSVQSTVAAAANPYIPGRAPVNF